MMNEGRIPLINLLKGVQSERSRERERERGGREKGEREGESERESGGGREGGGDRDGERGRTHLCSFALSLFVEAIGR